MLKSFLQLIVYLLAQYTGSKTRKITLTYSTKLKVDVMLFKKHVIQGELRDVLLCLTKFLAT